ncbi:hypothetical protein HNP33_002035 [Comamonas odontotermitis]|uniref:Uncharacterized protein n=1 Tax=Comamonas odontotermitis TaxID=379895 RepID=A0ABR6RFQ5_9BURK|nr:hypothetical protein [Comamonas odontotermitis]MBB6577967.1 hypothetical protein [Comamonas odontotermitis]
MNNEIGGHLKAVNQAPARMSAQSGAASRTTKKLKADQKTAGLTKLAKVETVALWHAVNWMEVVLREWKRDGFKDDQDQAQHEVQRQHLTTAKRALRNVNAIRKEQ